MTNVKNQKTVLFAIAAIVAVIAVSTIAIGSGRIASAATHVVTKHFINTGVNIQTTTNQEQKCETTAGGSPITSSCIYTSTNTNTESGGFTTGNPK